MGDCPRGDSGACDTANFHPAIAPANLKPRLPQRGHNRQGRHDVRQLGLALVVDRNTELPLAHVLYQGRPHRRARAGRPRPAWVRKQAKPDQGVGLRARAPAPQEPTRTPGEAQDS
jgi:transposase